MWDVKAAEDGDREAQFKVAETYQHGSSVVQASMPAAAKMYEAAAKQGHLEAARRYAHCLLDGNGVDKDAAAAVEWFGIAAEGGHADAQFQLGLCYHAGTGTAKDLDLTIKWLQKAGEQRNVEAQYRLGMIFQQSISADQVSPLNTAWYPPRRGIPRLESHSIAPAMVSSTFGIPDGLQARFNLQLARGSDGRFGLRFQRLGRFGPSGPSCLVHDAPVHGRAQRVPKECERRAKSVHRGGVGAASTKQKRSREVYKVAQAVGKGAAGAEAGRIPTAIAG